MKRNRLVFVTLVICMILQLFVIDIAKADPPEDLTGQTDYLVVHETSGDYSTTGGSSILTVTKPDGTEITPVSNVFSNVPDGSTINLDYVFHLENGDGAGTIYSYSDLNYFTITLPEGIAFHTPNEAESCIYAIDSSNPETPWLLGHWGFVDSHTIQVDFTAEVNSHSSIWGKVGIVGTFNDIEYGDDTERQLVLGSQSVFFRLEEPEPPQITLQKSGLYDAAANTIEWTVTVTPPEALPALDGFTLVDDYSSNQTFISDSFFHGAVPVSDVGLDLATANQVSYTFPADTDGEQIIKYKTLPTTFGAENGSVTNSVFTNNASVINGSDTLAGPVQATVTTDWIGKSGSRVTTGDDSIIIRWEVDMTVPEGGTVTEAMVTDTIPTGLDLVEGNATYPIQFIPEGESAQAVASGSDWGTYAYVSGSPSTLTYRLPSQGIVDGQLSGSAKLVYYTELTDRDTYLNNNGAVNFTNGAELIWHEMSDSSNPPSDTSQVGIVGIGGLLSKSGGGAQNFTYPGYIRWTVTVNSNKINMKNAKITDTVPQGQELLIDASHPFTVNRGSTEIFSGISDANLTSEMALFTISHMNLGMRMLWMAWTTPFSAHIR